MTLPLLTATGLTHAYHGRPVLRDVALSVAAGEMVALVGPNGAGKSTLLRCLAGLQRPDAGSIRLSGTESARLPPRRRARLLGYLAQSAEVHWPLTVERLVTLGRLPHLEPWARPGPADGHAVETAIDLCDVAGLRTRTVTSLSGGERARVLLARALAAEPALLLADEPVAGLDPYHQLQVMDVLRARADAGMAVVMVLHDLTLAARFCTRAALLDAGRLVADGAPTDVLRPDLLEPVYGVRMQPASLPDGTSIHLPWQRWTDRGGER